MKEAKFTARLRDSVFGLGAIIRSEDFDKAQVTYRDQTLDLVRGDSMWSIPLSNVISVQYDIKSFYFSTGEHGGVTSK